MGRRGKGVELFLSTPSAGRATVLSVHAQGIDLISIHALRGEGDVDGGSKMLLETLFLSTPSAGRATPGSRWLYRRRCYFYPRPPRGGRRLANLHGLHHIGISIHALRGEGDLSLFGVCAADNDFYPRPPRGGRRGIIIGCPEGQEISIHALRGEGDGRIGGKTETGKKFLSTPSAGRATVPSGFLDAVNAEFLSTPSAGRATVSAERAESVGRSISIHALRGEGDSPIARSRFSPL